ncbi:hypothetical protein BN946_scf184830.g10 [Trametes cinnabarina]|uniref:Uncharacterized protein n=1 Tax=Pycnoporus cinnabarinus TaxID=5643 RepID=A0A060SEZ3_PYCCI|nr:hypothetical protein BN946_scf184830.g10 [Trametes cinnabarina]
MISLKLDQAYRLQRFCSQMMATSALTKQKSALRNAMRATLANLSSDEIQAQCTPGFLRQIMRGLGTVSLTSKARPSAVFSACPPERSTPPALSPPYWMQVGRPGLSGYHLATWLRTCLRPRNGHISGPIRFATPPFRPELTPPNPPGKTLYVPKMLDKERGIMDFLQIYGEDDLRSLPSGQWGIREPETELRGNSGQRH